MGRKTTLPELDKEYPYLRFRIRKDVADWIKHELGKAELKRLIYELFHRAEQVKEVAARRSAHRDQFKKIGVYLNE